MRIATFFLAAERSSSRSPPSDRNRADRQMEKSGEGHETPEEKPANAPGETGGQLSAAEYHEKYYETRRRRGRAVERPSAKDETPPERPDAAEAKIRELRERLEKSE